MDCWTGVKERLSPEKGNGFVHSTELTCFGFRV
jgi:hypothetical protein